MVIAAGISVKTRVRGRVKRVGRRAWQSRPRDTAFSSPFHPNTVGKSLAGMSPHPSATRFTALASRWQDFYRRESDMNHCTKEQLIAFETRIKELWEAGDLPFLIHLCGGNEDQLIELFQEVQPGDWIFSTHRSHYHYLLSGGSPERLEQLIRTGNSMFVFGKTAHPHSSALISGDQRLQCKFLSSSVLAGCCGIAAGVAWGIKESQKSKVESPKPELPDSRLKTQDPRHPRVWCFLGDGAEEEGHFFEAAMFVEGHDLPCTFVIEDNDRSVDTLKHQRRGRGMTTMWSGFRCVRRYRYTATYPHAGSGCKHQIEFNPEIVRKLSHGGAENTERNKLCEHCASVVKAIT